ACAVSLVSARGGCAVFSGRRSAGGFAASWCGAFWRAASNLAKARSSLVAALSQPAALPAASDALGDGLAAIGWLLSCMDRTSDRTREVRAAERRRVPGAACTEFVGLLLLGAVGRQPQLGAAPLDQLAHRRDPHFLLAQRVAGALHLRLRMQRDALLLIDRLAQPGDEAAI